MLDDNVSSACIYFIKKKEKLKRKSGSAWDLCGSRTSCEKRALACEKKCQWVEAPRGPWERVHNPVSTSCALLARVGTWNLLLCLNVSGVLPFCSN